MFTEWWEVLITLVVVTFVGMFAFVALTAVFPELEGYNSEPVVFTPEGAPDMTCVRVPGALDCFFKYDPTAEINIPQ